MEEGSRLPRPLTVQLKVADGVSFLDITFAFWKQMGKGSVHCVAGLGQGRWQITFTSQDQLGKAKENGLKIDNTVYRLEPLEDNTRWVTIRGAPYEMSRTTIATALEPFGQILHHEYEIPKETAPVTTGVRRVRIRMKRPVPNFVRVGSYSLMCTYQGVTRVCRRCQVEGHIATECRTSFCRICKTWGHALQDCPESRQQGRETEGEPEAMQVPQEASEQPPTHLPERGTLVPETPLLKEGSGHQKRGSSSIPPGPEASSQQSESGAEKPDNHQVGAEKRKKKKKKKQRARSNSPVQDDMMKPYPISLTIQELFPELPSRSPAFWLQEFQRGELETDNDQRDLSESASSFASVCASPERRDRSPVKDKPTAIGQLVALGASPEEKRRFRKKKRVPGEVSQGSSSENETMS